MVQKISEMTPNPNAMVGGSLFETSVEVSPDVWETYSDTLDRVKNFVLNGLAGTSVGYTPSGNISANTVSGAITELDNEKVAKAGDTMTGDLTMVSAANITLTLDNSASGSANFVVRGTGGANFAFTRAGAVASGPLLNMNKSRGTVAVPTIVSDNDQHYRLTGLSYNGTTYQLTTALFSQVNEPSPSGTAMGGRFGFFVNTQGTNSLAEIVRIQSDGLSMFGANIVLDSNRLLRARSYTVAALPTPGIAGRVAYASNCRVFNGAGTQEGAGAGTGSLVIDNGSAWRIAGTNVNAVA